MTYQIEFVKQAIKQFKALPTHEQQRLSPKIDALATEPRPLGVVKLSGEEDLYLRSCTILDKPKKWFFCDEESRL